MTPPHWSDLPDRITHDTAVICHRLDTLESRMAALESEPAPVHQTVPAAVTQFLSHPVKTPIGEWPLPVLLIVGFFLLWRYPELVTRLVAP